MIKLDKMLKKESQAGTKAEQRKNDDVTTSSPACTKPIVVRSPNSMSPVYEKILVSNGFNKNEHGTYVLCHKETEYKFYLSSNFASCRVLWLGSPMTSIFHGMSVDNIDDLYYLIKNVLVKIPTLMAKTP